MQDLLNEDDFIKKIPEYNPWKYLAVVYAIAFILLIIVGVGLIKIADSDTKDLLIGIAMVTLPTGSTFVMTFIKKQFITVPLITIAVAILIMLGVYYIPFMALATFSNNDTSGALTCGLVYMINFGLCSIIIFPIINIKKKRLLK